VEPYPSLEDERGVDIGQIRRLLAMSVAERVEEMVAACNRVLDVQAHVRRTSTTARR
jgi:hypothetical protein